MTKDKRDRLFKKGRPFLRPFLIMNGEEYHRDLGVLWVAHKKNPFQWLPENITQEQFASEIIGLTKTGELVVAEDRNKSFKEGVGIVALIIVRTDDQWKFEPHAQFMPWSTTKNKLRTCISFFQYVRYNKKIGVCVVESLDNSIPLFDKCCEYGVLHKVGKIINGDPRGDETIYSVKGKKQEKNNVRRV